MSNEHADSDHLSTVAAEWGDSRSTPSSDAKASGFDQTSAEAAADLGHIGRYVLKYKLGDLSERGPSRCGALASPYRDGL